MANVLSPYIDRCIFGFVETHTSGASRKKTESNIPDLIPMSEQDKNALAQALGIIGERNGILIQTCGINGDFSRYHIWSSGCMTLDILGNANGIVFKVLKHKGTRQGCHCIESRDIGAYDTCMNGCKYCYANQSWRKTADAVPPKGCQEGFFFFFGTGLSDDSVFLPDWRVPWILRHSLRQRWSLSV